MTISELDPRTSSSWLDRWWLPFLYLIETPIVTVPVSAVAFDVLVRDAEEVGLPPKVVPSWDLLFDPPPGWTPEYYGYSAIIPTVLAFAVPGLLNLAPIAWLFSKNIRVKIAALVTLLLGALRFAIPVLVLMFDASDETVTNAQGVSYFEWPSRNLFDAAFYIFFFGALAWLATLLVWGGFAVILSISHLRSATTDLRREGV